MNELWPHSHRYILSTKHIYICILLVIPHNSLKFPPPPQEIPLAGTGVVEVCYYEGMLWVFQVCVKLSLLDITIVNTMRT